MKRVAQNYLNEWLTSLNRKPLVIRGARQVGKTWLVREFAKSCGRTLIEINFEKHPTYANLFESNDPQQIMLNLSGVFTEQINAETCLLFLDEIQAFPQLLAKLRWFAEDLPALPVIAAGSLLEFVLADHTFSMPVGRISYLNLEPLSFEEYLLAHDRKGLCDYLAAYQIENEIPLPIHEQLLTYFKDYILVGGMPAVVASFVEEKSFSRMSQIQHDILSTYRNDFAKYRGKIAVERLEEVITSVPAMLGNKFVYSHVNAGVQSGSVKQALELLEMARLCYRVTCIAANGLPLAAEKNHKIFKEIFLDVGLCNAMLGLNLNQIRLASEINMINNGGLAEQVVGQLLRTINPFYITPELFYWVRNSDKSNAEIDYIIQHENKVIPIEVKAGTTGTLKSLQVFITMKQYKVAVRINSDLPSLADVNHKNYKGDALEYKLLSIPFYLIEQLHRLLNKV